MYNSPKRIFGVLLLAVMVIASGSNLAQAQIASKFPGVGRDATPKEVAAWDIDVRADFKGLPAGSGSVAKGQDVWESKCAQCHGIFGESGEVFNPLVGGTNQDDIRTGHVARLNDSSYPGRTTFMKLATVSTLWDYINRAMPWTAPKSLSTEEVYAVTAFLLNLSGVVSDDFVLSNKNMGEVQKRMPNRNGMNTDHALWPGQEFKGRRAPDTRNTVCMNNCAPEPKLTSYLPDFARNAHGNLAEQNRIVGAQRGADTIRPAGTSVMSTPTSRVGESGKEFAKGQAGQGVDSKAAQALLQKYGCLGCHAVDRKVLGPALTDVAKKHAGKVEYLADKIRSGSSGVWGAVPMPAQSLPASDAKSLAEWIATGAGK